MGTPHESSENALDQIRGHEYVKRAIEVAVSGGHHLLFHGPPEVNMFPFASLASSLRSALEHQIASCAWPSGKRDEANQEYFVVGAGKTPTAMQAHSLSPDAWKGNIDALPHGCLLLLQCGETTPPALLKALVTSIQLCPGHLQLLATSQPCPCGYFSDPVTLCYCSSRGREQYWKRHVAPLNPLLDIEINVPRIADHILPPKKGTDTFALMRDRIQHAQHVQQQRTGALNAFIPQKQIRQWCPLDDDSQHLLTYAQATLGFTKDATLRSLKVARTIADLAGSEDIAPAHLAEAFHYRRGVRI